jgi:hypothetical protein
MSTDDTSTANARAAGRVVFHGAGWTTLRGGLQVRHAGFGPNGLLLDWRDWSCPVVGHTDGTARRSNALALKGRTVEWDGVVARCLFPGCGRASNEPVPRDECLCYTYEECQGECCGPDECSCSSSEEGGTFWRAHIATCPDCRALVARTGEAMRVEPPPAAPGFDVNAALDRLEILTVAPAGVVREELLAAYRAGLSAGAAVYMKVVAEVRRQTTALMTEASLEIRQAASKWS